MNAARRDRQKDNRRAGGKHTGQDHKEDVRCERCRPLPGSAPPRSSRNIHLTGAMQLALRASKGAARATGRSGRYGRRRR